MSDGSPPPETPQQVRALDQLLHWPYCCICFRELAVKQCAVDAQGVRWDVCSDEVSDEHCAQQAGLS